MVRKDDRYRDFWLFEEFDDEPQPPDEQGRGRRKRIDIHNDFYIYVNDVHVGCLRSRYPWSDPCVAANERRLAEKR